MSEDWIPKCDLINKYDALKKDYDWLSDRCYNRTIVDKKDLNTEEDYIREINLLEERLHTAKQIYRENRTRFKNEIEYYKKLYEHERNEKFKAQRHEFPSEGLIYFSDSIRNYFIQGLEVIKEKFLLETMPESIRYETGVFGEYIEEYNWIDRCIGLKERPYFESKAEWGSIIEKMIKALKYQSKYQFNDIPDSNKRIVDKTIKEGIDLFIKYSDHLWF